MPSASYPTKTAWIHGFGACCLALASLLTGCGGDDGPARAPVGTKKDGGPLQDGGGADGSADADVPPPPPPVDRPDSGALPGDPPPELAGLSCAVDTNKLYDLVSIEAGPRPTQLAVDVVQSSFGLAYVGPSENCMDAVFLTQLQGASGIGEPETMLVSDECTAVEHASLLHTGSQWVLAIADSRHGPTDVSTVVVDADGPREATRVTESDARELETVIASAGADRLMVAWVDVDVATMEYRLRVRLLDYDGVPVADEVVLGEGLDYRYSGLALQIIGERFIGLGYRRVTSLDGSSEIILDILDVTTGERDRDSWVLADSAGSGGGIDLGTGVNGGAIMYSVGEGTSQQLWLQLLAPTGMPAPVMLGLDVGGPSPPERIVGPPIDATDASLARVGDPTSPSGYAIAYRVLPRDPDPRDDEPAPQPRIRVYFVNRVGDAIGDSDVALALPYGGRTAIESGYDGRIVVGWSDSAEDGQTTLTAVKLPCVGGP